MDNGRIGEAPHGRPIAGVVIMLAFVLLSSCNILLPPADIDLGDSYWFRLDAYGTDVYHKAYRNGIIDETPVIPPTVVEYAWNDTFIVATCWRVPTPRTYWIIDKRIPFRIDNVTLDTLDDGQVVNRMPSIVGPVDSMVFSSFIREHNLHLEEGFTLPRTS